MSTFAFKALDLSGSSTNGEIEASDKQAVAHAAALQGPDRRRHRGEAGRQRGRHPRPLQAGQGRRADDRHRASSRRWFVRHVAAARALRDRGADRERQAARRLDRGPQGRRGRHLAVRLARAATPTSSTTSTWRWSQAGETGGILEQTLVRVANQLEKDDSLRRQVQAAMVYPSLIGGFAVIVLLALVAFLVPVFEKVFKDFGGELPAITKFTVGLSRHGHRALVRDDRGHRRRVVYGLPHLEEHRARAHAVGPLQAQGPDEDRRHRAEGRAGALLAHASRA